ncbi:hypothetical protein BDR22DRAFT_888768 [Usnea florida]
MSSTSSGQEMQYHPVHFALLVGFSGVATTAVVLRLWARKALKQTFKLHDYLIVVGLIFALAETSVNVYSCCFPVQRRIGTVPERLGLQLLFLSPVLWATAVTIIRATIIVLYVQIFPIRTFNIACYTTLGVNVAFGLSAVIADCLICRPITYRWAPSMVNGSCGDQKSLDMYVAVMNLLLDVEIVILPMPIVWRLRMARSKKMALSGMFGMGVIICATTVYRVQQTSTIGDPTDLHAQETYCNIALLTSLEALLGVISACLPLLKPLWCKIRGSQPERAIKATELGKMPILMRRGQMENSSSGHPSSEDYTSTTDFVSFERAVEGECEIQGLSRPVSARVLESATPGKPQSGMGMLQV